MIPYASNTGTRRNLAAMREACWRLMLTPGNATMRDGFKYGIDNGAWPAFMAGKDFQAVPFQRLIEKCGETADFVIAPDIVAGGKKSLDLSVEWIPKLPFRQVLLAVQDGMTVDEISGVLVSYPNVGIFLGGSTEWKLATIYEWGKLAERYDRWYHVGRVNTARRVRLCAEAGATSFDGTSVSRFASTLPLINTAARQPSLLSPRSLC